ncbi:MAG: glycoside hydrolase family 3 N-terminal domain-containing protein [Bacteroides graminisolvens]|nr:glycoside hydrolase family 3 N-terminal domain-containing protein [Bacteroides graminisolvens]
MKNFLMTMAIAATVGSGSAEKKEMYKDPSVPVKDRVEDLLSRMTLEEKVGQMNQFVGIEHIKANSAVMTADELKNNTANAFYPGVTDKDVERWTAQGLIGSFLHVLTIEEANHLQSLAMKSRLQIPIIFGIDAIHGNANAPDNTVYPTNINLACSFDTAMAYKIARQTAKEMRAMNMHWTFNPNVEVARDARWGRVGETYGEDPYLVTLMGVESVKGYQGALNGKEDVLACIKHFVGGSEPINGTNGSPTDLSERTLREVFFPPFKAVVEAGAMSLMTAHNELNGIPCHSNEWLMQDVLRGEWKFPGFVVSDWMDIEHIHDLHATAENIKEAFYQSIMAGMDMHMHGIHWNEMVVELVKEGRIPESRIDESVRRILDIKFRLGLFEQPFADTSKSMKVRLSKEHRETALEAARNGIVLLKNEGVLPLDASKYKKVLVTGINANDMNVLGDWSAVQKEENVTTILEGLRQVAPGTAFDFVDQGWDPRNMDPVKVAEAEKRAKESDLNIVVAGEYMMRFRWTDRTDGEDTDRSDLDLVGLQNELIRKVAASGKPTILILVNGRPLGVEWAAEHLPAIVEAWAPGMYAGQAVAEILYGKVNPSAKLAITIPRSVGQLQMIYNHKPSQYFHPYAVKPSTPLWPFGYGLSYTTYKYDDLKLSAKEVSQNQNVEVSVKVTNTGQRDGVEIVQLYIRDKYSSVTRPVKELKDFARVALKAGESKVVTFTITPDKLAFYDKKMKWIVEPGEFVVMAGASSADESLLKETFILK